MDIISERPAMIPLWLAPILAQGMGLLGNAALVKGKDWVEQQTGVKLDKPPTPEDLLALRQFESDNQEMLLTYQLEENKLSAELVLAETKAVTERWQADMASDSWLSKNIRPLGLIGVFGGFFALSTLSAFGIQVTQSYVELLGQWGMLIFSAYYGSRGLEKIVELRSKS